MLITCEIKLAVGAAKASKTVHAAKTAIDFQCFSGVLHVLTGSAYSRSGLIFRSTPEIRSSSRYSSDSSICLFLILISLFIP
ncbi:MAG: hypothetical protein IJY97_03845 [Clostridia bacterium]|nr:hypothetical protein [Clostridia bacterium]